MPAKWMTERLLVSNLLAAICFPDSSTSVPTGCRVNDRSIADLRATVVHVFFGPLNSTWWRNVCKLVSLLSPHRPILVCRHQDAANDVRTSPPPKTKENGKDFVREGGARDSFIRVFLTGLLPGLHLHFSCHWPKLRLGGSLNRFPPLGFPPRLAVKWN